MPLIRKTSEPMPATQGPREVLAALTSGTTEERWAAARAAADVPGGVEALGRALVSEDDTRVRQAICTSLARVGTPECVAAVVAHVRSDNAEFRTSALDALRAMPQAVESYLPRLLADEDSDVRLLACELARTLPGPEVVGLLCGLLHTDSEPNVCAAAVEVLAEIGGPEALPSLAQCTDRFRDDPFLGFAVKVAIERIGTKIAEPRD